MFTIDSMAQNIDSLSASFSPKYTVKKYKLTGQTEIAQFTLEQENFGLSVGLYQYYSSSVGEISTKKQNPLYLESQKKFTDKLIELITSEPIEDGYTHPADELIEEVITKYPNVAIAEWIQLVYNKNLVLKPSISASILRCVGRLPVEMVYPWGFLMAYIGLKSDDLELRESSVRAFENWGGEDSLKVLENHVKNERKSWLVEYINQVIKDLSD